MTEEIDLLVAIGSIATPILLLILSVILSGFGWIAQKRFETVKQQEALTRELAKEQNIYIRELENKLRDDRIAVYNAILEPFILVLSPNATLPKEKKYEGKTSTSVGQEIILSLTYKQMGFKMALMGSDGVLKAYNNLMQYFYKVQGNTDPKVMIPLLGTLLLEIRRGMGNISTDVSNLEMLEWLIKDVNDLGK